VETLITGGTGLVGRHLVMALQERGDAVRALVLPTEDLSWLQERDVAIHRGDIRQPETLTAAMRGVDVVFHLAAMQGQWRPIRDYREANVQGTENVCRAAMAAGARRIVHVSSWTIYGMALHQPAREDSPLAPWHDPYWITKAEGDELVRRMIETEDLPAVIIRPGTIFGPGDRLNFGRIAERLAAGRGVVVGSGRNAVPLIYVTDVVQGLLLAADHERALGQAYNITNDQFLTQGEFLEAIARELGVAPPFIHVPYRALYAAAYLAERIALIPGYGHAPVVTRHGVALFGADSRISIDKARRELGFAPQVPLREGVRLAAAWYQHQNSWALDGVPAGARHVGQAS
jgi:nucleoside-diphosphate-sugar epimerase